MGYRCTVESADIVVKDIKAFREWLKDKTIPRYIKAYIAIIACLRAGDEKERYDKREWVEVAWLENKALFLEDLDENGNHLSFDSWNDNKIIGYWYPFTAMWCRDLALFIEGQVILIGEDNDAKAKVIFKDGKCTVALAEMEWNPPSDIDELSEGVIPLTARERLLREV